MTRSEIERVDFESTAIQRWERSDLRHANWPVVYVLDEPTGRATGSPRVYVGETRSASSRLRQHLNAPDRSSLTTARVIVDATFNKSVCLDLEAFLIRLFAGDGQFTVLNRNEGIVDSEYFDRPRYRRQFDEIFDRLRAEGLFVRSIPEIENSDLFKLSPFKSLTTEQATAVVEIMEALSEDLRGGRPSTAIVQGEPGTGKTILAIYLLKLIADIADFALKAEEAQVSDGEHRLDETIEGDSVFSDFFLTGEREAFRGLRIGLVVPQQSLRESIRKVFAKTPGLDATMVVTPFDVGRDDGHYDLLVVDESHRLNQRANQPSGPQNKKFTQITEALFGSDDPTKTQLDWIRAKSEHQIFLLDAAQAVRPADLPKSVLDALVRTAMEQHRLHPLTTQMRVRAGTDYVAYVRAVLDPLSGEPRARPDFGAYDLRFYDDLGRMREDLRAREAENGLSRLLAGYAWPWVSKERTELFDIEIGDERMRWNSTQRDWIASSRSVEEVGSIHTVQGYDLNYAGVIIGPDLRWDTCAERLTVSRKDYHDKKGKENNRRLGRTYTDQDLLQFVVNIYAVLLTRGMLGTYVYVCDSDLREHLRRFF